MPYKNPDQQKAMLRRVRPANPPAPFVENSKAHIALKYLKMNGTATTYEELALFNPGLFAPGSEKRVMTPLVTKGLITALGDSGYQITRSGIDAIYAFPLRRKKRVVMDDAD